MNNGQEVLALFARVMACNARVAGMQAENAQRQIMGHSMAYNNGDFNDEADQMDALATEIQRVEVGA